MASFQTQYGIRLSRELRGMSWREFAAYINGLGPETPLGRVVAIRAEKDPKIIREFNADQKRVHSAYQKRIAKKRSPETTATAIELFKQAFIRMAGEHNEQT